ncbi:MAG: right-handed parallel beta-helix repeat-containing protein [Acidimicrobiales bacterium]
MTPRRRNLAVLAVFLLVIGLVAKGVADHRAALRGVRSTVRAAEAPAPAGVCGSSSLEGPGAPPPGAVTVPAGALSGPIDTPDTTYYFAPGTHTIGTSLYSQIDAGHADTYMGAPGAVISGQGVNAYAFVGTNAGATGVTIEYLTITRFASPNGNGAVAVNAEPDWTIENDTISHDSTGAGLMIGTGYVVAGNCLEDNGEYGFDAYTTNGTSSLTGGPSTVTMTGNEIVGNGNAVEPSGCGCSGGGKFWEVDGATVSGNLVLDNGGGAGMWADTNNVGFDVTGNIFQGNAGPGWEEEISYNFVISANSFTDNAWTLGPGNPSFPEGAIYVSESGGDGRVPGPESGRATISDNVFTNNWSGVVLWESADRFCGSPDNSSSGACTLVAPSVANLRTCDETNLVGATPTNPLYGDCRWRTQHVSVTDNVFSFAEDDVTACAGSADACGENAIFSNYGTSPGWSPYHGTAVETAITSGQGNLFSDNTYSGPWSFDWQEQGKVITFAAWQADGQDGRSAL